jgi:hypothetical protein
MESRAALAVAPMAAAVVEWAADDAADGRTFFAQAEGYGINSRIPLLFLLDFLHNWCRLASHPARGSGNSSGYARKPAVSAKCSAACRVMQEL